MKKLTTLLSTLLLMVLTATAQTDVTSTYLTNADFASTDGWTQDHSGSFWSLGNGLIGTYAVANDKKSATDGTHLATEYCLGTQCRWNGNYAAFTQTTSALPAGSYVLFYDVQNTNASTSATYENRFSVAVGGNTYTDVRTEWMSGSTGWTRHAIAFTLTESATATISLGYGTGSNNFGSGATPHLYISHLKLMNGSDVDAVLRSEYGLADATYANPVATDFVVNGTFTDNTSGWTCTGDFQNKNRASNQQGDFTVPFFENWNGSAKANKMYQTIGNVPNGTYKLKIAAFVNTLDASSQYVFANDEKTYLTTTTPTFYEVWVVVTNNTVEIGLEQTTATANWMGIDNVSLTYYGAGDVRSAAQAGAHKTNWDEALANAKAVLANADYANVTGSERTALQNEINKAEPTTADGYDEAVVALNAAVNTFTTAKASYDEYAAAKADAEALGADGVAAPTTAAEAETAAQTLKVNQYNKVEAVYNYDVTSTYVGTWTKNNMDEISGQHWSGDGRTYFDAWKASGNSTATQTLSLPAGEYVLKVAGRGQANVTTVTMSAAGKTVTFLSKGDTGRGIDLTGATNFAETTDTYTNSNNGRGWEWRYIPLSLASATDVEVTLSIVRSAASWASFTDFAVLKSSSNATASDYAALAAAISAASGKTLGFDAGEYAPYNNVAAQKALAAAQAIDPSAENEVDVVTNATQALTSATWTANSADVQPIYNGMFATVTTGANYPEGWARTNGWGHMESGISGDYATAYYNQPGALVYGSTEYYSMPLHANQAYKLTFSYRSHETNSNNGMTVRVSTGGSDLIAPAYAGNGSTSDWKTEYAYFTTTVAGNYVIRLENGGNTWMTNVSLEKIDKVDGDLNGDGKIDEDDEFIASLKYTVGDVDGSGTVDVTDVKTLVGYLLDGKTTINQTASDITGSDGITLADVTALVNGLKDPSLLRTVDDSYKYAHVNATVYAEQSATENAAGANYALTSAVCYLTKEAIDDPTGKYDMKDYLTTLNIGVSLSNVVSVSVYAKGKENIAGLMTYNTHTEATTYSAGETPSAYVNGDRDDVNGKNMQSDVVTVTGDNAGTYVAYLLPVSLSQGVTVTVRTSDGKYYSQDFDVTAGQANSLTFTATTATNNWMATIPGNVNFSMLSTPGAHNAATSSVSSSITDQAKCQSETIQGLLDNGVRAFDLRPQYKSNSTITADNLTIYHGSYTTGVLYKDAIATIAAFLDKHPSEAISVIMMKEEGSGTDQTSTLVDVINEIHNQYSSYFKVLDHSYYTLDDFRGRIFYGCRPDWNVSTMTRVEKWPDDASVTDYTVNVGGTCKASVEDAYNSTGNTKKSAVNAMLDQASANTDRSRFHYTYTSVAWKLLGNSISYHANIQNPAAATYISNTLTGPAGYVYADYIGSSSYSGQTLLKAVIDQNYKYVHKGRSRVE